MLRLLFTFIYFGGQLYIGLIKNSKMKRVILIILLSTSVLWFGSFSFGYLNNSDESKTILVEKENGGTRSATLTEVEAILHGELLWITLSDYTGEVWIEVAGIGGVLTQSTHIESNGQLVIDLSSLQSGNYTLRIILEIEAYSGYFQK
jgi:hypothetical protein